MELFRTTCPNCNIIISKRQDVIDQLFKENLQFTCPNCYNDITEYLKIKTMNTLKNEQILDILSQIPGIKICGTCDYYFIKKRTLDRYAYSCMKHNKDVQIVNYCNNFKKKNIK